MKQRLVCIVCPKGCRLTVEDGRVTGAGCERGMAYAVKETTHPTRVITSTVCIEGAALTRLPVKTDSDIPKECIFEAMKLLDGLTVAAPVRTGDVIVPAVCGTNANWIATRDMERSKQQ